jgi:hypothetical protein
MSNNSDGFDFLTSISAVELHRSDESLDDGAESFSESFSLISASSVWDIDLSFLGLDGNVVNKAWIFNFNIIVGPLGEELGCVLEAGLGGAILYNLNFLSHKIYKYYI